MNSSTIVSRSRVKPNRVVTIAAAAVISLAACSGGESSGPLEESIYPNTMVPSNSTAALGTRTSQAPTNGQPAGPAFDDFTLNNGGSVRTVSWQGTYCRQTAANSPAPTPTASVFTVSIHADASGRPATTSLRTATFTLAQANQQLEKTVPGLTCGLANNVTVALYNYSVTLPDAFTAAAGQKYWISIVATTPTYDVLYGWRDGTASNNVSLQLYQGTYSTLTADRAFALAK